MFTAVLYFVICSVMFYSAKYFRNNMKYWVDKVTTIFSEGVTKDLNHKIIQFLTYLMDKMVLISKVLLIFLFLIIVFSSTYLNIYYHFSEDLANNFDSTMKAVSNTIKIIMFDIQ